MAELIEREALRDTLYEADAITMRGVAILNQFPAADVRPVEWIPVAERLPKQNTSVLVYRSGDNRIQSTTRIDVCPYLGDGVFCLLGVTHWMPLPEPPKENEQSET